MQEYLWSNQEYGGYVKGKKKGQEEDESAYETRGRERRWQQRQKHKEEELEASYGSLSFFNHFFIHVSVCLPSDALFISKANHSISQ